MQLTTQTMSSREIAELTGKRHDHVMRDIKKMLLELYPAGSPNFGGSYFSDQNKELPLFNLDRKHTDCLLTGYSSIARMKVIDRWHELEAKQLQPALPANYIEALESLVAAEKEKAALSQQLQIAAPKVEYHDRVLATDNGITTTEIAAELGITAQKLNAILAQMKIQRKVNKRWVLTAANLSKGYDVEVTHVDDGGKSRHAMKWSEKGRKFIHELMEG